MSRREGRRKDSKQVDVLRMGTAWERSWGQKETGQDRTVVDREWLVLQASTTLPPIYRKASVLGF